MVKTKRALGWWWNQLRRFDIDLFFNIFLLPFFFFFVSFSTPLLEPDRVLVLPSPWRTRTGHWSTWLLSRANYYHGMQSLATPSASSHLLPLLFFFVTFTRIYGVISCIVGGISSGSFGSSFFLFPNFASLVPIWIARQMASRVVSSGPSLLSSLLLASNQSRQLKPDTLVFYRQSSSRCRFCLLLLPLFVDVVLSDDPVQKKKIDKNLSFAALRFIYSIFSAESSAGAAGRRP